MDSGSSGSLQSSSGGEEEYDSRANSISAFMSQTGHVGSMSNLLPSVPPPSQQHHTPTSSTFDPLSNYFDPISRTPQQLQNPSSLLNLDTLWSRPIRSDPNCIEINPILISSPSLQSFIGSQGQPRAPLAASQSPAVSLPPMADSNLSRAPSSSSAASDQHQVVRNPRKRSRASRRAPTTVLTTDTTNFRAMVQEFTGIPAPPFTSSPFPRSRLDLFGAPCLRSGPLETQQPCLLRPFAQKVQPPQFLSSSPSLAASLSSSLLSSSVADAIASTGANNISSGSTSISSNTTSVNYQLVSELGLLKHHQSNPLNMQNPNLTFPSLSIPQPPRYPLANSTILGTKSQGSLEIPSNDSHLKMGSLVDFGLSHHNIQLPGLTNVVPSNGNTQRKDAIPTSWGDGMASNDGDQVQARSANDGYNYPRNVTNGRLSYSASSSNFHGEKGPENVATRGEGMMESWICSSD